MRRSSSAAPGPLALCTELRASRGDVGRYCGAGRCIEESTLDEPFLERASRLDDHTREKPDDAAASHVHARGLDGAIRQWYR
jgi:hypothetical protein